MVEEEEEEEEEEVCWREERSWEVKNPKILTVQGRP